MRRTGALLTLAVLVGGSLAAQGTTTDKGVAVVQAASRKYLALSSFQAAFRQLMSSKSIGDEESTGMLYQEGKNHLALRWSDPPKEAIVLDGTSLWMYFPSTSPGTVKQYPQQNHPTYGSDVIGTFLDNPIGRYRITYVNFETIDGHVVDGVIMEPIAKDPNFLRATLWLDRVSGMPRRIEVQEGRDSRRTLFLSSLIQNPSIPPAMFKFDAKGLKIIAP